jgi:ABC-2 type transport system permease protein
MTTLQRNRRIVALESRFEIVKLFRTTAFIVPTLAFPVLFYLLFGVVMGGRAIGGSGSIGVYLIATYGAFGVIAAALSAFGISIAIERGQGLLQLKHATPMPLYAYIAAKLAAAVVFSTIVVLSLVVTAAVFVGVRMDPAQLVTLVVALVVGTIPFALLGLTIGYTVAGQASIAVFNLIYMPMAFLSGLWIPIDFLPKTVQAIAEYLPAFHLGQLALGIIEAPSRGTPASHIVALLGFTLLFLAAAIAAYRFDQRKNYA